MEGMPMLDAMMMQYLARHPELMLPRSPKKVKCPVCNAEHDYKPASTDQRLENRYSHDARALFIAHSCPVCLEDNIEPPMVALACGHIVCVDDFQSLGGKVGADAMLSWSEATEREREAARAEHERNRESGDGPTQQDMEGIFQMMQASGWLGRLPEMLFGGGGGGDMPPMAMEQLAAMFPPAFDSDEDYDPDYDEEEDDEDDDDSDYDDMPGLIDRNGQRVDSDSDDDDSDEDMPGLIDRNGERADSDSDDDDSGLDDLPPLVPRGPAVGGAEEADGSESGGNESEDVPPLIQRHNDGSDSEGDSDDDGSSSLDDMPALVQLPSRAHGSNNNHSSTNRGARSSPRNNRTQRRSGSSSSNNQGVRGAPPRGAPAANSSDSDSDDDIPDLLPRDHNDYDDSSDDTEDDEESDVPVLIRRGHQDDSDDDESDSSSDAAPPRAQRSSRQSAARSAVQRGRRGSAGAPSRTVDPFDDSENSDLPSAMDHPRESDIDSENGVPRPDLRPLSAGARPPASSTSVAQLSSEQLLSQASEKAKKMKIRDLKAELRKLGINPDTFLEKGDMVKAYAEAVVRKSGRSSSTSTGQSEPPRPVGPYADLPALIPAKDPPTNGAWVLKPKPGSGQSWELLYCYEVGSKVESHCFGDCPKEAIIIPAFDGNTWIYTPSPDQSSDTWEISSVSNIIRFKRFDFEPGATITPHKRYGLWALCPTENGNPEPEQDLILMETRKAKRQRIHGNFSSRSTLFLDKSGGVWVHVPREGSTASTVQPGIWHFSEENREGTPVLEDLSDDSLITYDGSRRGLLVLCSGGDNKSKLLYLSESGDCEEKELEIDFSNVQAIVDDGGDGAYVHCRRNDRWKLCRVKKARAAVSEVHDCPKTSKITSDGTGGVWMWKKVGKKNNRSLVHIDSDGNSIERSEPFPSRAVMGHTSDAKA